MPHPQKNQNTFSNYNLEVEQEGHTGLSQLPRNEKESIFLGNCNYLKTMSKQKSLLLPDNLLQLCLSIASVPKRFSFSDLLSAP